MSTSPVKRYVVVAKVVGICDTNQTHENTANDHMAEFGGEKLPVYKAEDFDKMVQELKADIVIVTTIDCVHHQYCIRAMKLGCEAIAEKPMTIDEVKLQQMIDAEKRTGKQIRVLFNYHYAPHHTKMRELIASGVIGEIATVHMDWILDCAHGSDIMRRWYRNKSSSGGIHMYKSIHHYDLVHFWLDTEPELVYCIGGLKSYGKENAERGERTNLGEQYLNNEAAKNEPFTVHINQRARLKKLYLEAEHEDGYIHDRNCFAEGITIENNLSMIIKYSNGDVMRYNTCAYAPWEAYRCVFNGSKGRIEVNLVERVYPAGGEPVTGYNLTELERNYIQDGVEKISIVVYSLFEEPYIVNAEKGRGGHGVGDPVLRDDLLVGTKTDEFQRAAFIRDGGNAVLIGVGPIGQWKLGLSVKIQEVVKWWTRVP